jgi:hypothetical protein
MDVNMQTDCSCFDEHAAAAQKGTIPTCSLPVTDDTSCNPIGPKANFFTIHVEFITSHQNAFS